MLASSTDCFHCWGVRGAFSDLTVHMIATTYFAGQTAVSVPILYTNGSLQQCDALMLLSEAVPGVL
jgi:hypothetical protein